MAHCASNISDVDLQLYQYSSSSRAFVTIFVPIVAVIGLVGNGAFVFVVYRVKFMRSLTNIYLVNLAIADCSLLLAAFSQYIGDYVVSSVYDLRFSFYTSFGCSMPNFLIYLCYYASVWTVTLVSIERYLAICHTFWHRIVSNKRRAMKMVVIVWLVSLAFAGLAAPYTPITVCALAPSGGNGNNATGITTEFIYCEFACDWCAGALYITDVVQFLVALVINVIMYALIIYHLGRSTISSADETDQNNRSNRTRNTVAKMLIINGVVFFICLFPFSLVNIENIAFRLGFVIFGKSFIDHLSWVGRILFLVNSVTNTFIYNATNPRYRLAFREAFDCRQRRYIQSSSSSKAVNTSQISQVTCNTKM